MVERGQQVWHILDFWHACIEELTKLRDSGEYPALRADLQGEIDYFTANQQRMDYRRYRELVCRSAAVPWRAPARTWWRRA